VDRAVIWVGINADGTQETQAVGKRSSQSVPAKVASAKKWCRGSVLEMTVIPQNAVGSRTERRRSGGLGKRHNISAYFSEK
jgi:hypothetical protein